MGNAAQLLATGNSWQRQHAETVFFPLEGALIASSEYLTEAYADLPMRDAGVLSKFYIRVTANTIAATTTFTIRVSAADTAITLSVGASTTGVFEDTVNTAAVVATDEICGKYVSGGAAGNLTVRVSGLIFTATSNCVHKLACYANSSLSTASQTRRWCVNGDGGTTNAAEVNVNFRFRSAAVLSDLYFYVISNARTSTTTVRTRKNSAAGGQSVSVIALATGAFEDTVGSDTYAAGDDGSYEVTTGTGSDTLMLASVSTTCTTMDGAFYLISSDNAGFDQAFNVTNYYGLSGILFGTTTESNSQFTPRFTFTSKELHAYVSANTIATNATTIRVRDNAANGNQLHSISAGATGLFADSVNTDTITSGTDSIDISCVTPNTSGLITLRWIGVMGQTAVVSSSTGSANLLLMGVG